MRDIGMDNKSTDIIHIVLNNYILIKHTYIFAIAPAHAVVILDFIPEQLLTRNIGKKTFYGSFKIQVSGKKKV